MVRLRGWGALIGLVAACGASAAPLHRDLVRNGGFEDGDFSGWTLSGNTEYSQVFSQPYGGLAARGGQDYALLGPQGADGVLAQRFADTRGEMLTVSFWVASNGGSTDDFSAWMDGTRLMALSDTGSFGWTRYQASFIATGADTLSFMFRDDQDYLALDRVRVTEAASPDRAFVVRVPGAPIPEPPVVPVLAAALLAVFGMVRLRARRRPSAGRGEG